MSTILCRINLPLSRFQDLMVDGILQLSDGQAEVFGTEVSAGEELVLKGQKVAV